MHGRHKACGKKPTRYGLTADCFSASAVYSVDSFSPGVIGNADQYLMMWFIWPGSPAIHLGQYCPAPRPAAGNTFMPGTLALCPFWGLWFWASHVSIGVSITAPHSTRPQLPSPLHSLFDWLCRCSSSPLCLLLFCMGLMQSIDYFTILKPAELSFNSKTWWINTIRPKLPNGSICKVKNPLY